MADVGVRLYSSHAHGLGSKIIIFDVSANSTWRERKLAHMIGK